MARKRVAVGPPKPKIVSKVRRTKTQAYGSFGDWMAIRGQVLKRDGYKCRLCPSTHCLQVDHIIPVSKGGQTVMHNLWTLCATCHAKRPGHKVAKALILATAKKQKSRSAKSRTK